jgi:hypothetical protein
VLNEGFTNPTPQIHNASNETPPTGIPDPEAATRFIKDLFGPTTEENIHLCSLGNERDGKNHPKTLNTRDADELSAFVRKWDQPERGLFFCVGTLKGKDRNKENVAEISVIHADIDFKDIDEGRADVERKLANLVAHDGRPYPPSCTVFTGHGIHAYGPFFEFVRASGLRQAECVTLRWSEVNFGTKQIVRLGKGGRRVVFPITGTIREILFPLQGQHPEYVFTYVAVYGNRRLGLVRGQRYRLTLNGAKSAWQRMRTKSGVRDFRFHDYRHDFGTKLLRKTGNLKLVQKALNHKDIKSTMRYAHVLDEDVAAAVEAVANSRKNSRTTPKKSAKSLG